MNLTYLGMGSNHTSPFQFHCLRIVWHPQLPLWLRIPVSLTYGMKMKLSGIVSLIGTYRNKILYQPELQSGCHKWLGNQSMVGSLPTLKSKWDLKFPCSLCHISFLSLLGFKSKKYFLNETVSFTTVQGLNSVCSSDYNHELLWANSTIKKCNVFTQGIQISHFCL